MKLAKIMEAGCTACIVFITPDHIFCANVGDSRAVLKNKSTAIGLCEDHKPNLRRELKRINESGHHYVEDDRVDGSLAMSRALGDFEFKDVKTLRPEQ